MADENKGNCAKKKAFAAIAMTALVLSIIATALSGMALYKTNALTEQSKPVVISKQYDKGQNMEKALKTEKPVIVWFYTDWCGFCQRFAPTFGAITKDRKIKKNFAVAYVNAEYPENQTLMMEYGVEGFPTVFLVNPKTKEKVHVDNAKLFAPEAKKDLVGEFLNFAKAGEDKAENKAEEDKKAEEETEKADK